MTGDLGALRVLFKEIARVRSQREVGRLKSQSGGLQKNVIKQRSYKRSLRSNGDLRNLRNELAASCGQREDIKIYVSRDGTFKKRRTITLNALSRIPQYWC